MNNNSNNRNNSNNNNNNRRRGRGNNNRQGGGGQQVNRIDSRARGNAPQLLEKYRKLALDAHLNGDRVTEEYYLQFADHYFRVIADTRQRQDEGRPRRDDRWQEGGEGARGGDYGDDMSGYADGYADAYPDERPAPPVERAERSPRFAEPAEPVREEAAPAPAAPSDGEARSVYEPAENPFVRDGRGGRGQRQRGPRRDGQGDGQRDGSLAGREDDASSGEADAIGFDPSALPPAVASTAQAAEPREAQGSTSDDGDAAAEPRPKRRGRRPASRGDDTGETLQAVS